MISTQAKRSVSTAPHERSEFDGNDDNHEDKPESKLMTNGLR